MKATRTNKYKSSTLFLLWTAGFISFNTWFMHDVISPSNYINDDKKWTAAAVAAAVHDRNGKVRGFDEFDKGAMMMKMEDDAEYDDDHHQSYSANGDVGSAALPELEYSSDNDAGGEEKAELSSLTSEKMGKIAWLMSFPNSGTSFTSLLIRHASNATTASNYGMECNPGQDGKSVPVHEWSSKGPYWLHPPTDENSTPANKVRGSGKQQIIESSGTETAKSGSYNIPPSGASILTKTHCGSRCSFCPPNKYIETWQSFLINCLSGSRSVPIKDKQLVDDKSLKNANAGYRKEFTTYHPSLVEKAVHLIRNPFDNLVSRFHHEQKEHKKRHDTQWTNRYSNNPHGFRKWCADEDTLFRSQERKIDWASMGYDPKLMRMHFEGVACHAEFFRYVQWHNYAIESVNRLEIPVMFVHYEDYTTDLAGVTDRMIEFLNMTRVGTLPSFDSNKDYSDYFSLEERAAASELMRVVASDAGKELIERYWVQLDYRAMRKQIQAILD